MEQNGEFLGCKVPQRAGITRDTFANSYISGARMPVRPDTYTAFANPQRQAVGAAKPVMMTGTTGNIPVARQYLVVEKQLSDLGALH